jgi:hypothetical protein
VLPTIPVFSQRTINFEYRYAVHPNHLIDRVDDGLSLIPQFGISSATTGGAIPG